MPSYQFSSSAPIAASSTPSNGTFSQRYLSFVKDQEKGKNDKFSATAEAVCENPKEGCEFVIGYGHNITKNDPLMRATLTEAQATDLLINDLRAKRNVAQRVFDEVIGTGCFERLSQSQ